MSEWNGYSWQPAKDLISTNELPPVCRNCNGSGLGPKDRWGYQRPCNRCSPAPLANKIFTRYVVGFMFTHKADVVVLIQKNRPEWQKGLFNGLGGKIEAGETPAQAMSREFYEEGGLMYVPWDHYATLIGESCEVYVFRGFSSLSDGVYSRTDEKVSAFPVNYLPLGKSVPNLSFLIPLALVPGYKPVEFHFTDNGKPWNR